MRLFDVDPPPRSAARARRARQRNGLRYGPADNNIRATPANLFDQLHAEFTFTLDVAALPSNARCARYFTPDDDGLRQPWAPDRCWMNPPYSDLASWTAKAAAEARAGALVVALLPVRTDLGWFHTNVLAVDAEIRFLRGRLRFGRPFGLPSWATAPHPSMVVVWRPT